QSDAGDRDPVRPARYHPAVCDVGRAHRHVPRRRVVRLARPGAGHPERHRLAVSLLSVRFFHRLALRLRRRSARRNGRWGQGTGGPWAGPKTDAITHDTRGLYRIASAGSCEAGQAPVPGGGVMFRLPRFTSRKALIIAHDLLATVAALLASFYIRFEGPGLAARLDALLSVLPGF